MILGACSSLLAKIGHHLLNVAVRSSESRIEARPCNAEALGCSASIPWVLAMHGHPVAVCQEHMWEFRLNSQRWNLKTIIKMRTWVRIQVGFEAYHF